MQGLISINYQPPNKNFDKSLVKGRMLTLVQVKEEKYSIALEAAAGESLFSIVVENDTTCGVLIKNKCFNR